MSDRKKGKREDEFNALCEADKDRFTELLAQLVLRCLAGPQPEARFVVGMEEIGELFFAEVAEQKRCDDVAADLLSDVEV